MGSLEEAGSMNGGSANVEGNGASLRESNGDGVIRDTLMEVEEEEKVKPGLKEPKTNGRVMAPPSATFCQENGNDNNSKRRKPPLPLEVGTRVLCRWRDDKLHPVKVIERRKLTSGPDDYQYYVHYTECEHPNTCFTGQWRPPSLCESSLMSIGLLTFFTCA